MKKSVFVSFVLAIVIILGTCCSAVATASNKSNGNLLGDVNKDGELSITDATLIQRVVARLDPPLESILTDNINIYETVGGYYGTNGVFIPDANYNCMHTDIIAVYEGEKYMYSGVGVWNAASVLWYDQNKTLISAQQFGKWGSIANKILIVPENVHYARFCSFGHPENIRFEISIYEDETTSTLTGKKIVYDGDSICFGAGYRGGYAKIIADEISGNYENYAMGGARLITAGDSNTYHSVVDNLPNLPKDGDLYCFEGGINDYWTQGVELGTFDYSNFDEELDTTTVCGALETIFRYSLDNFTGKPICFVITHKIQKTAYAPNSNGDTFKDYHDAMVGICQKYSIPYYDAFNESGLNGWNTAQGEFFLIDDITGEPDGCHPNENGYKKYYVPQLLSLFEKIMPHNYQ